MKHTKLSNRQIIATENDLAVLKWIHRFGGLSTRQLARLHWENKRSGLRMAQRTVSRLKKKE